jgi:hypothetical protein
MRRFKVQVGRRQKTWRQKKLEKRGRKKRVKSYWLEVIGKEEEGKRGRSGGFIGFSELGAGCSKDGLGQDVPATVKMRAGRPRSL